ncbi:ATP-binding protein [Salinisphaera sp. Q1T1-3]|uniref:sensor histidine kinase n=1 Tax=Salinisphaera sp. Q1T1-3 TaxID=2321229 RepID=UPI000E7690A5|nr:ATP-binding protein [Salinisphaera sp. Q1T1-3]RJS92257.1 HAMP domain-containing protein [Salinisphaera sp. Q1T1-3]
MSSVIAPSSADARRRGSAGLWIRPRSITGLVIAGFVLVSAPLIVAIAASVFYVDSLHTQSERLVMQGVAVTRDSKRLTSLLVGMERSARQYRVLGSSDVLARFHDQAARYREQLDALAGLDLATLKPSRLHALDQRVGHLSDQIGRSETATDDVIAALGDVRHATERIGDRGTAFVRDELDLLQATAASARRFLMACVFALIPVVIVLGLALTYVITRPLRQILDAINRLGAGELSDPVRVVAPVAELDQLGDRLDWMRWRLAAQEQEKQQFLRHMSHELKTPLASIREGADLLTDGSMGTLTNAQHEVAGIIGRNSVELVGLIENLLNFAAWREQNARLEVSRFDLTALIERLVARHQLTIRARELRVDRPAAPAEITADLDRMQLIVDNLLANAVKYAAPHGLVHVAIEHDAEATHLYVGDDGPGVAPADRERIFDAFACGQNTPPEARGVSGTGIGLSVVRDCARAHGGDARVISSQSFASIFHVRIPHYHVTH